MTVYTPCTLAIFFKYKCDMLAMGELLVNCLLNVFCEVFIYQQCNITLVVRVDFDSSFYPDFECWRYQAWKSLIYYSFCEAVKY